MPGAELADLLVAHLASEELRLDRLRRDEDVIVVTADPGDEPPHVLAVRDDRVRMAVDVAGDGERERVRERARLGPDRRPEHERAPVAARAQVGRREDRAAGVRGDDRVVVAGDLERGARPVNPPGGERSGVEPGVEAREPRRQVAVGAAIAEHLDALLGGQALVERHAVGHGVVGQQRDRHRPR